MKCAMVSWLIVWPEQPRASQLDQELCGLQKYLITVCLRGDVRLRRMVPDSAASVAPMSTPDTRISSAVLRSELAIQHLQDAYRHH